MTPEQAAKAILESLTTLDPEQYRMGHTKVRLSSLISSSRRLVEESLKEKIIFFWLLDTTISFLNVSHIIAVLVFTY